jgi:hypothetical protein
MEKIEAISKVLIDTTRPLLIYIFVGVYVYIGITGVINKEMTPAEFIRDIEPHVGMMIAFMFGERAALKRPDDGAIHSHMQNIMSELGQIKASTTGSGTDTSNNTSSCNISSSSTSTASNTPSSNTSTATSTSSGSTTSNNTPSSNTSSSSTTTTSTNPTTASTTSVMSSIKISDSVTITEEDDPMRPKITKKN